MSKLNQLSASLVTNFQKCAAQSMLIEPPVIIGASALFNILPIAETRLLTVKFVIGGTISCTLRNTVGDEIDNMIPQGNGTAITAANLAPHALVGGLGGAIKYTLTGGSAAIGAVNNGLYQIVSKLPTNILSFLPEPLAAAAPAFPIEMFDEILKGDKGSKLVGLKIGGLLAVSVAAYVGAVEITSYLKSIIAPIGKSCATSFDSAILRRQGTMPIEHKIVSMSADGVGDEVTVVADLPALIPTELEM